MEDVLGPDRRPATADAALRRLRECCAHNPNDPRAFLDLANEYDMLDREEEAEQAYEKVRALGLDGLSPEDRAHWFIQFGSTLRLLGKLEASQAILQQGEEAFPANPAMPAFRALTALADNCPRQAALVLLEATLRLPHEEIARYRRALTNYVAELAEAAQRPHGL